MLNWRLTRPHIPAREACLGRIHRRITATPQTLIRCTASSISTPHRNESTSTRLEPSPSSSLPPKSRKQSIPQHTKWQGNQDTPEHLRRRPRTGDKKRTRSRTPIRASALSDEAANQDVTTLRLVPNYLLRPAKSVLLRYAMTNSLREKGVVKSDHDTVREGQLERAFAQPVLDPNYAHCDVEENDKPLPQSQEMMQFSLHKAIASAQSIEQLHELFEVRMKYPAQHEALCTSWDILEMKTQQLMNDIHRSIDPSDKQSVAYAETKKLELLTLLSSTLARVDQTRLSNRADMEEGFLFLMRISASVFSPQSLINSMASYRQTTRNTMRLPTQTVLSIIRRLLTRVEMLQWQDQLDPSQVESMLEILTGLNKDGQRINGAAPGNGALDTPEQVRHDLFSLVNWGKYRITLRALGEFARLVATLGNTTILREAYPILSRRIASPESGTWKAAVKTLDTCVHACLATRDYELAIRFAVLLAKATSIEQVLPMRTVMTLLLHDKSMELHNYVKAWTGERFLREQLSSVERRLGVVWDEETGKHVFERDMDLWEDQKKQQLGEATTRPPAQVSKLLEEVIQSGSSSSVDEISQVIDTLNDTDGLTISLGTYQSPDNKGTYEYAWFPESAPIKFSKPDSPTPACSFGLLRTRPRLVENLSHLDRTRHLLQLGYIAARKLHPSSSSFSGKYTPTGHILAWDRREQVFVVMYIGKGYGTVAPGPVPDLDEMNNPLPYVMGDIDLRGLIEKQVRGEADGQLVAQMDEAVKGAVKEGYEGRRWDVDVDVAVLS